MKKRICIIVILILVICVGAFVAYGYFTAPEITQSADVQTAEVQVKLHEDFPQTDENGAPIDSVKTFWGSNTGNRAAYVRVHLFPCVEYHYTGVDESGNEVDEWRTLGIPQSALQLTVTSPGWISDDGYLYYSQILKPGDNTSEATVSVAITDPDVLPEGTDVRLNLNVELESAQASHDAYKKVFRLAALPNGVEVAE